MTHPRRPLRAGGALLVLLALGAGLAFLLTDALGIRSERSEIPAETLMAAPQAPIALPPAFATVTAPASTRVGMAVDELRDAVAAAGATDGTATLDVVLEGSGETAASEGEDTYRLEGTPDALRVVAASEAGAALGVYDLAAAVRDGRPVDDRLGEVVESELGFRMVDLGAVGVTVDEDEWAAGDDYSHNSKAFADVILPDAPYIDETALALARADFEAYVRHVLAEGYNAIAIPGLVEYLTFSEVGDGDDVYGPDDEHVARAHAMREAFGPMWEFAHDAGLRVFYRTDMLTLTTPLEAYLTERFGGLATDDPKFWDVYAAGLDELYEAMPYVDGVLIRIGEAGRVYDLPGWDYYSELAVTTVDSVRAMLTAFTEQADRADREVIFRTWSVGVGAVGDMHTNDDSYRAVLDGIASDRLIVSTKYTLGDFYSHLPLNHTLEVGDHRRIVEFQSRREFENFGAFPNDLGVLYQEALQRFIAANPNLEGIWTWTQDGGPWRAGPLSLELKAGFWQLYELNTELAVRLARDPGADPAQLTADWARRWFSDDPATVQAIGEAMAQSREAIAAGLYIGPFADRRVFAIGLEPPPMMWIFEWDIVTGDSAVLDVIYDVSRDELDEAIAGGDLASAAVERMREAVTGTDAATWRDPALRTAFLDTLEYQASTYAMLGDYREMFLRQAQWHDTGEQSAHDAWDAARRAFEASAAAHQAAYAGDPYYPAYNLVAAQLGVDRAERDLPMAWAARILLVLVAAWIAYGIAAGAARAGWPGARAARALWVGATRPWRAAEATEGLTRVDRALVVGVPALALVASRGIQTWFLAPSHLAVSLGAWAVFVLVLLFALRSRSAWPVLAAVGGAAMLRVLLLLVVLAPTGPGGYWFHFWTDPLARSAYVTVAFAAFGWVIVAGAWGLAGQIGVRRAVATVVAAVGAVLAIIGAIIGLIGLEAALTLWNDEMALLPWGLSRILGISVYLDIPADTAWWVAGAGAVLVVVGSLVALSGGRRTANAGRSAGLPLST
ncbi:hypothetical protein [Agromyces sp. Marseille-P2726]|uniref:hypothetical protein n=1 Tax=Agromyces sp. Marseille-P2726 TaxID=2709132 RepID=UPI001570DD77|nr:hypothetical protein [Agromyces sp. Marseille-P2726]